jgi:hypothetical protein
MLGHTHHPKVIMEETVLVLILEIGVAVEGAVLEALAQ